MSLHIEKLIFGGQGLARDNPDSVGASPEKPNGLGASGKAIFVWNALPGEEVEVEYIEKKKDYAEAIATKIITASPDRVTPREDHFLSSSPWQMISWEAENEWKKKIAVETYGRGGGMILQGMEPEIVFDNDHQYGYRNKIEYSFAELKDGTISLAFFHRGGKTRLPVTGSELAEPVINKVADEILAWINRQKIPIRSLKSLIIRSNNNGEAIAALFIKDKLTFPDYPETNAPFLGFHLYYSTHKSPASVPTALLYSTGQDYLTTELLGTKLKFGLLSFFQINIPIFEKALQDIAAFVGPHTPLVDYYSGVGAISLPLSRNRTKCELVDNNEEAIAYAKKNIALNNLTNCEAACLPAEKIVNLISRESIIILDPPRAGLHQKMIVELLIKRPPRIVYLSCNLSTQARDVSHLAEGYKVSFLKLYNFFPRTPHIEGLCVLDRV